MKTAVIGGGASGLTAAIAAAENGADVTVYESGSRVGRKILSTGNGRCNMTNINASKENYHGANPSFAEKTIAAFWVKETLDFFSRLGILYKVEDGGKVYPYSDQASAVLDVLRMKTEECGVKTVTDFEVCEVKKNQNGFSISAYNGKKAFADRVIIACGGKAAPSTGSNGSGYDILKKLGHGITSVYPSLVQLKTETDVVKKLKGIKVNGALSVGKVCEKGEVLFTEYGLSGPAAFSVTSRLKNEKYAYLDIMPEYSRDAIINMLYERIALNPKRRLEEFFTGMLNKRIGQALLKYLEIVPLSRCAATLSESDTVKIADTIKHWRFCITGTMSWNNAQVTKGGADTAEFDDATMESKKVSGLYACGEILDIDGDCGGYNLQWAWSSGYIAGISSAK